MDGSIRVSAKTVDDAITEALIQLGVTSDRLEYEVIEKGSSGFLGIGMKQAVIEARRKPEPVAEVKEETIPVEEVKPSVVKEQVSEPVQEKQEEKAEEDMIKENYDLECDVLKVGHHGSYTATGDNFLTKADPAYAVISAGKDNSYGHPHAATLAKLEDDDVQIYRTDTMGTIEAVSDGNQIHMETEKGKINE